MFGISGFELFIIVVFILIVFGPSKFPEMIKIAGLGIKKFKKAKEEMDSILHEEIIDPVMEIANNQEVESMKKDVKRLNPIENLEIKDKDIK